MSASGALLATEVEYHREKCDCGVCACRRYLNYRAPDSSPTRTLKIASYDGVGGGSGEPDRAYDSLIRDVDLELALGMVRDDFLRLVGGLNRNLKGEQDKHTMAMRRGALPVLKWLERFRYTEWVAACLVGAPGGWRDDRELFRSNGHATLRRLLDECAVEMARNLGHEVDAIVVTFQALPEMAAPPEWEAAPANRR